MKFKDIPLYIKISVLVLLVSVLAVGSFFVFRPKHKVRSYQEYLIWRQERNKEEEKAASIRFKDILAKEKDSIKKKLISEIFVLGDLINNYNPNFSIEEIISGKFMLGQENLIVAKMGGLSHAEGTEKYYFTVYDEKMQNKLSESCGMVTGIVGSYKILDGKSKKYILFMWEDGNQGYFTWKGTLIWFDKEGDVLSRKVYKYDGPVSSTKGPKFENGKLIWQGYSLSWNPETESFDKP